MDSQALLLLAAAAGAVSLAICAALWALALRRAGERTAGVLQDELRAAEARAQAAQSGAEAFETAILTLDEAGARLVAGTESLAACAAVLGVGGADPAAVVAAVAAADPDHARRLKALVEAGEACAFEARGPAGGVEVEGRAAGAPGGLYRRP